MPFDRYGPMAHWVSDHRKETILEDQIFSQNMQLQIAAAATWRGTIPPFVTLHWSLFKSRVRHLNSW